MVHSIPLTPPSNHNQTVADAALALVQAVLNLDAAKRREASQAGEPPAPLGPIHLEMSGHALILDGERWPFAVHVTIERPVSGG